MKTGRLILTSREDLIETFKNFYLGKRTDFLVVAYDQNKVNISKFKEDNRFHFIPFISPKGGDIFGQQYRVWIDVVRKFRDVDSWVIHNYDFLCKPCDKEIISNIKDAEYAMIGTAFPVWKEGMRDAHIDTYPFPQSHEFWHHTKNPIDELIDEILMKNYSVEFQGIKTLIGGFSNFIATTAKNLLLLDSEGIRDLKLGGIEQVPHTIWKERGITPIDMRKYYSMKILLDVVHLPFEENYDMLYPVKFWPGQTVDKTVARLNRTYKIKKLIKKFIRYEGRR
jgi:hypothetical protein